MAITWEELSKLPDDVKYQLPDGTEMTLGDIRSAATAHVDGAIGKRISDLTPREQKLADKEKLIAAREKEVHDAMVALADQPPPKPTNIQPGEFIPLGYTPEQWSVIKTDPYSRPLVEAAAGMAHKLAEIEKRMADRDTELTKREQERAQREESAWINRQMEDIVKADARYKDTAEQAKLVEFSREVLSRRDIGALHRARHYDEAVKKAEDSGYQRGLKEGKVAGPVPSIVHSTHKPPLAPVTEQLPKSFNEFVDAAAADQSLINEVREASMAPHVQQ